MAAHPNQNWTSINVAFNPNRIIRKLNIFNNKELKELIENYKFKLESNNGSEEIIEKEIMEENK